MGDVAPISQTRRGCTCHARRMSPDPPAGWYPDGQGGQRYWDGQRWTDYTGANYWELRSQQTGPVSDAPDTPVATVAITHEVLGKPWYQMWEWWLAIVLVSCSGFGLLGSLGEADTSTIDRTKDTTESATPNSAPTTPTRTPEPTAKPTSTKPAVVLLYITDQKDGDSFVASDGREYRLGLVNTPEASEQCGSQAAAFTREFVAGGFTANVYSSDSYGRRVAEVLSKSGKSLNVALAKSGFGNDRYLEQFRHENPDLGRRLDVACISGHAVV
jgi:endonuclease YncB( thermonuclease family)